MDRIRRARASRTPITAWIDGGLVATTATANGSYSFNVIQPGGSNFAGKTVTFKVDGIEAAETAIWSAGSQSTQNLTSPGQGGFLGFN